MNKVGKYHLDNKGQAGLARYQEKNKPAPFNKKEQVEKLRAEYLKKKQQKENN
ncbi:MAG: hypothetical protein KBT36_09355 [Kurthia sp.]|nr:hypothetical protein [Candidatus Kurthia equi]